MLRVSPTTLSVYLFLTFHLLRGAVSQDFYSAAASSTILLAAASSTLTSSSGSPELAAQTSILPGAATSHFCDGVFSDCYITANPVPTNSATCSGTSNPYAIYVTETTTVGQYLTVSGNFSTPQPVYITPLPFCTDTSSSLTSTTSTYAGNSTSISYTLNYNSTNLLTTTQPISTTWIASSFAVASDSMIASALEAFATTTVLVTKKTPVLIQQTSTLNLDFGGPPHMLTSPSQLSDTGPITSSQPVSLTLKGPTTTPITYLQPVSSKITVSSTTSVTSLQPVPSTSTGPTTTPIISPQPVALTSPIISPQPVALTSTRPTTTPATSPQSLSSTSARPTITSITSAQPVPSTSTVPTTTSTATPGLGGIILSAFNNPPTSSQQTSTQAPLQTPSQTHTQTSTQIPIPSDISPVTSQHTNPTTIIQGVQPSNSLVSTVDIVASGPSPSSIISNNVPVQVGPVSIVTGGQTTSLATVTAPVIISGQTFSIYSSQVVAPGGIVLSIPTSRAPPPTNAPSVLTIGGQQFTQTAPSQLQVSGSTIDIPLQGITAVVGDETYTIYPSSIAGSGTAFPLPIQPTNVSPTIEFTAITAPGLTFDLGPSVAVISGTTYEVGAGAVPTAISVGGETVSLDSAGLVLASTTIAPLAAPPPSWSVISADGLTFSIEPGEVYISSSEYSIGNGATPTTITVGGETVAIGTEGVVLPSTTIALSSARLPTWSTVSVDGLVFSVDPSEIYISSTEYILGSGATPTTLLIGGETVAIRTEGVVLSSTTIAPPSEILQTWSTVSVDGLVFSVEPGEVYISSTEYALGSGATPTTFVVGGETVVVGSNGVILSSTTIAVPTETGFGFTGIGSRLMVTASIYWGALLIAFVEGLMQL